ncbi:MAG: hypothetical protein LC750_07075 [Actinobacteria bacterium]|nr:hypothetical protein [Actinomycetota bacterium]
MRSYLHEIVGGEVDQRISALRRELDIDRLRLAVGRVEKRQLQAVVSDRLADHEFQVFSQWGEDGILQFLLRTAQVSSTYFVEFGVEDYREANTRFLLLDGGWSGLVLDSSEENIRRIQESELYWRRPLVARQALVTAENVNDVLREGGASGDIGLLSIDIDGNDYWVWRSVSIVRPAVVVIEYNSRLGPDRAIAVPYRPDFDRWRAHHSGLYYGASLAALCALGSAKGYSFIGCGSSGVNAFFVRTDRLGDLRPTTAEQGFVRAGHREARNSAGEPTFLSPQDEERVLAGLPFVDVSAG